MRNIIETRVAEELTTSGTTNLWKRARERILGVSRLLSKQAEMYLLQGWPAYFDRTEDCASWNLDGNKYLDLGFMGVSANILSYSDPKVDEAVRKTRDKRNLSTLNAPVEAYLAEALIELHPWADMARFARSGGEACAIAVRIGCAMNGKDQVAFSGYHGWRDWYLAIYLGDDDSFDGHLIPGLEPSGVPRALKGTSFPLQYNDLDALKTLMENDDQIGVIYMEVQRSEAPAPGFLEYVRELATFGNTLGNGYAISAIIGRASVMEAAQTTFISSTFWTERIGPRRR